MSKREVKKIGSYYFLKNQNCLKALIKQEDYYGSMDNYKYALNSGLTSYPKEYPCFVRLVIGYHGYHYPEVTCYSYESIKGTLERLIEFYEEDK